MKTRLLLVDDHELYRQALGCLLSTQMGMGACSEAGDGRSAIELARKTSPDIITMDVSMPLLNGIDATRRIVGERPRAKIIAISMRNDRRTVAGMFEAGACAYVLKQSNRDELGRAIQAVLADGVYLSEEVRGVVVSDYIRRLSHPEAEGDCELSSREREVLQLLAEGRTSPGIAEALGISEKTVASHRRHIMDKLNLRTVAELVKYAIREGLTPLEA